MGCDIHLHIEIKLDGEWHHYNHPDLDRSYRLFTKMAGVRSNSDEIDPISLPKGLPDDITTTTQYDSRVNWSADGHSHSWLSAAEIDVLEEWYDSLRDPKDRWRPFPWGYLFGNTFAGFTRYPNDRPDGLEDVRMVFWFDN